MFPKMILFGYPPKIHCFWTNPIHRMKLLHISTILIHNWVTFDSPIHTFLPHGFLIFLAGCLVVETHPCRFNAIVVAGFPSPFDSVQLVNITPITMVYGIYNELVPGANLNQHSHHIVGAGYIFYNVNLAPSQVLSKCSTIWGSESANTRTSLRDSCGCRQLRGKRTKQRSAEETATHRCWEK